MGVFMSTDTCKLEQSGRARSRESLIQTTDNVCTGQGCVVAVNCGAVNTAPLVHKWPTSVSTRSSSGQVSNA
jgi:hypothetical protein